MPGRHASRRTLAAPGGWGGLVPDPLRGRVGLGPGQLAVVAVVAVVGLVVTCWFLVRSGGHEVGAPVAVHTPAQPLARPQGSTAPVDAAADGSGAVGVRRRRWWSTSPARYADPASPCCARALGWSTRSGRRVARVRGWTSALSTSPRCSPTGSRSWSAARSARPPEWLRPPRGHRRRRRLVDLNTADQTALESLPEVGPVTAQAIIAWRTEHGGFSAVSQLLDVDGIGDATLAKLTPYVTL